MVSWKYYEQEEAGVLPLESLGLQEGGEGGAGTLQADHGGGGLADSNVQLIGTPFIN